MPLIRYEECRFLPRSYDLAEKANVIIGEYTAKGYSLTLRQIYYQFVARDLLPAYWADKKTGSTNNLASYQKLSAIVSNARLAGIIDWHAIEDRTRELSGLPHWDTPAEYLNANGFNVDKWQDQSHRVEIWVEKDAVEGIVARVADTLDIRYFSSRGYTSQTSIWNAGQRLKAYTSEGVTPVVFHIGDHDPSGLDMTRDIERRLRLFMDGKGGQLVFERIALNYDQVEQYNPPPNPAKPTDKRYEKYREQHGEKSWELDALDPTVIDSLVRAKVEPFIDRAKFSEREATQDRYRSALAKASQYWHSDVSPFLDRLGVPEVRRKPWHRFRASGKQRHPYSKVAQSKGVLI